jgi:gas vesicle protein
MDEQETNFSITAFFIGGILGASASLLFTPKSGKEFRGYFKERTDDYLKETKSRADILLRNSKTTADLLKRKAEDIMNTVQQYTRGRLEKPVSVIEKEIAGLKAALKAARASYYLNPEVDALRKNDEELQSSISEYEDESLPKYIGMGKGRSRSSYLQ